MTTPHDPHRDDGLSEEERAFERALAARLSRAGGPREPSAALDAAILAAARAAVTGDAPAPAAVAPTSPTQASTDAPAERGTVVALPPRKPKPRWPLGLSLAASLVLAAGIGIKLYDGGLSHDTAASAEAAADSAAAYEQEAPEPLAEAVLIDPPLQREPPPPPPPLEDAAAQVKPQARGIGAERAPLPQANAEVAEVDAAADAAGVVAREVPAPSAPVAPRMQAPPQSAAADRDDALDRVEVTGSRLGNAGTRNVGAAEHTRTPLNERRREATEAARAAEAQREAAKAESLRQDSAERRALAAPPPPPPPPPAPVAAPPAPRPAPATSAPPSASAGASAESGFVAEPPRDKATGDAEAEAADALYDDRPPVSADSPEFRQAWLERIRKLLTDGRRTEAKASLQEFRRRYPDAVVPDDLRPLLAPEPPPPTP